MMVFNLKLKTFFNLFKLKFSRNNHQTTILFADIAQSTKMFETYGDVRAHQIVAHTLDVLIKIINEYQGKLIKTLAMK